MSSRPSTFKLIGAFCVMTVIWGTTWAAIRIGLESIPPLAGIALRFGIAGTLLLTIALVRGVQLGRKPREKLLWVINGFFSFCVSYGVVYWGEQYVPSGLAAVLFATYPLFVAIIAHFLLPDERLRALSIVGILIGFCGVVVIFSEDFASLGGPMVLTAASVMLISPLAAAMASVLVKRWGSEIHPLSWASLPMLITATVRGAGTAIFERHLAITLDLTSVVAVLYLAVFGSAVTFSLYFWLLQHSSASKLALLAYLTPILAIITGAILLSEPITLRTLGGTVLVLFGVALASIKRRVS